MIALGLGVAVGIVLGLLGAGGSLLTVPALIFALGLTAVEATGTSLVAVTAMAAAGLVVHGRAGRCACRHGLLFAGAGVLTAVGAGWLAGGLPEAVLTIAFAVLLTGTALWLVWQRNAETPVRGNGDDPHRSVDTPKAMLSGAGVGVLTGVLGVGGGFAIVPALVATLDLPMAMAVGTSQLVVLVNALAGLGGRALGSGTVVWTTGVLFAVGGVGGATLGSRLTSRFSSRALRLIFAGIAVVVAVALVVRATSG